MAEVGTSKSFREFAHYLDQEIHTTKPYRYLVIETLLKSYPNPLSKKEISDRLRDSLKTNEQFEHYSTWSQLINKDELIIETANGFLLNVENLTDEEKQRLLKISAKRITNAESDFTKNTNQIQSLTNVTNKESNHIQGDVQEKKSSAKTGYYLVRFKSNSMRYGDYVTIHQIKNYKLNLPRQKIKNYKINSNQRNLVILYDTKANQIRIWGTSELIQKPQTSRTIPNIEFNNFEPLIQKDELIIPKWLLSQDIRKSMFGNKQIISIDKVDFDRILNSAVEQEDLFHTDNEDEHTEESLKINVRTFTDEHLSTPSKEILAQGIKEIQKDLLIDEKTIKEIVYHLSSGRHVLLAGPIGTGKTQLAKKIPKVFWRNQSDDLGYDVDIHTATFDWNTTDVIAGIVPRMEDNDPVYKIQYGCVAESILKNWNQESKLRIFHNNYRGTWLIIDEFNRADIDKAFGQLFTALETRTLLIPVENTPELKTLAIPKDYRIIGTLNTSDKHFLFKLSDALKRRFAYVEIPSPTRDNYEKEVFYALWNAMNELEHIDFSNLIIMDPMAKGININSSNPQFIDAVWSAYEIFSFVRFAKDMGTGVLKSIYQTLLTGCQISGFDINVLDFTLKANIIPQLERISSETLDMISMFCFENLHTFFRKIHSSKNDEERNKYANSFSHYLDFLEIEYNYDDIVKFSQGTYSEDKWNKVLSKWQVIQSNSKLPKNLPLFKESLLDLKRTFDLS